MDKCLRDVQAGVSGEETVMYADDVAVITSSATDTQEVVNRLYYGMKVNTKKAKQSLLLSLEHQKSMLFTYIKTKLLNRETTVI